MYNIKEANSAADIVAILQAVLQSSSEDTDELVVACRDRLCEIYYQNKIDKEEYINKLFEEGSIDKKERLELWTEAADRYAASMLKCKEIFGF